MLFISVHKLTLPSRWPMGHPHGHLQRELSWLDFDIDDQGISHEIPNGHAPQRGLYIFIYGGDCLKIGYAGDTTQPVFTYRHYGYNFGSTLANSIRNDPNCAALYSGFEPNDPSPWMRGNLRRINITFDAAKDPRKFVLKHLEAFFHETFDPRYEG